MPNVRPELDLASGQLRGLAARKHAGEASRKVLTFFLPQ